MWAVRYICRVRRVGCTDDHALGNDNARGGRAGGRGGGQAGWRVRAGGRARRGAAGLGRGPLAGSAAPPIRVRQCRAKIGGAADPATSPVSAPVVATSSLSLPHFGPTRQREEQELR